MGVILRRRICEILSQHGGGGGGAEGGEAGWSQWVKDRTPPPKNELGKKNTKEFFLKKDVIRKLRARPYPVLASSPRDGYGIYGVQTPETPQSHQGLGTGQRPRECWCHVWRRGRQASLVRHDLPPSRSLILGTYGSDHSNKRKDSEKQMF